MIRSILRPTLAAGMMLAAACDSPSPISDASPVMFRGDARHSGVFQTRGVDELGGVRWRFQTDGPVRSSPVVAEGTVYVGSTDGHLYAIEASTGQETWRVDVGSPVSSSPAVAGGLVLFVSADGAFHAVDADTGALRWQFATGAVLPWEWGFEGWDVYLASAAVQGESVVFGGGDGTVYALDLQSGEERWRFSTDMRIRSTPAISEGVVYIGGSDGIVYSLGLENGLVRWTYETEGASLRSEDFGFDRKSIIASPAVVDGAVYVGSRDGQMYALDQASGERRWRVSHDVSWAMSSPAVSGTALFAGTSDGLFVHRVDVTTGEEDWRFVGAGYTWSSPALAGNTVYIGDGGGFLRAINAESGEERWSLRTGGGVYSSPWVEDGVVYVGADDGVVYAVDAESPRSLRAVFWDSDFTEYSAFPHVQTRAYFELHGYDVLDANGLENFMRARIEDGTSSAVVFALPYIPSNIAAEPSDTVLLRRYLESGGKTVWLDLPPMSLARDETGQVTAFDRSRSERLLAVDFSEANFDFYGSEPTDLGRMWGLNRGWLSSYSIAESGDIDVLGLDEHGRAGAWVKSFGGPPGTGFVGVGLHDVTLEALEVVRTLAEYGLADRTR